MTATATKAVTGDDWQVASVPSEPRRAPDLAFLRAAGALEYEPLDVGDGSLHIVLRVGVLTPCCGERHFWLVNRDGRTRCVDCDEKHLRGVGK